MTNTNQTTLKINNWFYEQGIFSWRQNTGGMWDPIKRIYRASNKTGISDIIAVLPPKGRFLGIEVKTGKDRLRPEQEGFIKNILGMGGDILVVSSFEDFLEKYNAIFNFSLSTEEKV